MEKVFSCARELGYQPNIVAKRLREIDSPASYTIAVFWTSDFRAPMLVRFLRGLQKAIEESGLNIEFFIRQYKNDCLDMTLTENMLNMFHGAIVCNASEKDIAYIDNATFFKPIVLYNRPSPKYSAVTIDNGLVGKLAAGEFKSTAVTALSLPPSPFLQGMLERTDSFLAESQRLSIKSFPTIIVENSIKGGYEGVKKLLDSSLPDSIFCASDAIAIGALYALNEASVAIPGKVKLISVGNGDRETEEFTYPPLSVVYIPIEEMAMNCLKLLTAQFPLNIEASKQEIVINTPYIPRSTCPKTD